MLQINNFQSRGSGDEFWFCRYNYHSVWLRRNLRFVVVLEVAWVLPHLECLIFPAPLS